MLLFGFGSDVTEKDVHSGNMQEAGVYIKCLVQPWRGGGVGDWGREDPHTLERLGHC